MDVYSRYQSPNPRSRQLPFGNFWLPDTWLGILGPQLLRDFFTDAVMLGVFKANIPGAHTSPICFPF